MAWGMVAGGCQTVVSLAVSFVQIRLIFDYLPSNLVGTWFLFLTLAGYVALFDLGVSPTLSREISLALGSQRNEHETRQRIADLLSTTLRIFAAISVGVFLLVLIVGLWFLGRVAPPSHLEEVRIAWMIFAFGAAVNIFGNAAYAGITGLGNVGSERTLRAVLQLIYLGIVYLALVKDGGVVGLAAAWVTHGVLLAIAGWVMLRRYCPWLSDYRGRTQGMLWAMAVPSAKWAMTAFGSMLILNTDNVIIAEVLGTAAIPPYEIVAKVTTMSMYLAALIITSAMPFISMAYARGDLDSVRAIMLRSLRFGMGFMVVASAWFFVYAELFIALWTGPGNFVGQSVVGVFVVMLILEAHHRFHATVSLAMGRLVFHWVALGAGVLNIVLTLLLVRRFGLVGVALGSMIAQLLTNNWFAPYYNLRTLGLSVRRYALSVGVPLATLFGVAFLSAYGIRQALAPILASLPLQLAAGVGGTLAVSATVFWILLDAREQVNILRPLRRFLHLQEVTP